jgi:hypothetical protein
MKRSDLDPLTKPDIDPSKLIMCTFVYDCVCLSVFLCAISNACHDINVIHSHHTIPHLSNYSLLIQLLTIFVYRNIVATSDLDIDSLDLSKLAI